MLHRFCVHARAPRLRVCARACIRVRMEIRRGGVEGEMQERVPLTIFNDIALTKCIRIVFHACTSLPIDLTRLPLFLLLIMCRAFSKSKKERKKERRRSRSARYRWNIQRFRRYYLSKVYKINSYERRYFPPFSPLFLNTTQIFRCYLYK